MVVSFSLLYHRDQDWHLWRGTKTRMFLAKVRLVFLPFMHQSLNKSLITSLVSSLLNESNGNSNCFEYQSFFFVCFLFWQNDCAFARKLLLLFPFFSTKAQGVECVVQYERCPVLHTDFLKKIYVRRKQSEASVDEFSEWEFQRLHLLIDWRKKKCLSSRKTCYFHHQSVFLSLYGFYLQESS